MVLPVHFFSMPPADIPFGGVGKYLSHASPALPPAEYVRRVKEPAPRRYRGVNLILLLKVRTVPRRPPPVDLGLRMQLRARPPSQ